MPRTARKRSQSDVYHVVARGLEKHYIFAEKSEKERMLFLIRENLKKCNAEIYAYCIMGNHLHLLIKSEYKELSKFMAKILAEYAKYYNYIHDRTGYLFQGRYMSECVETESYLWNCVRYIHLNPVKANIIKSAKSYKYSSLQEYYSKNLDILHPKALVLYGTRFLTVKEFLKFHRQIEMDIFEDVENEKKQQRKSVAKELLKEESKRIKCTEMEMLAIVEKRNTFIKILEEKMEVSSTETDEIIEYLKGILKVDSN